MKITFEGQDIANIIDQMSVFVADVVLKVREYPADPEPVAAAEKELRSPWPKPVEKPVSPAPQTEKPKRARTERQLANDAKLRAAALEKLAAKRAAKAAKTVEKPVVSYDTIPNEPAKEPEIFADPSEVVRIRQETIKDLQSAYANGHQQEVFELLSRFGNGAKSFRELPPEAFMPIREAIDKGALT